MNNKLKVVFFLILTFFFMSTCCFFLNNKVNELYKQYYEVNETLKKNSNYGLFTRLLLICDHEKTPFWVKMVAIILFLSLVIKIIFFD